MFDLDGRVVVVTGGNGGIGLAMGRAVAEAGASVAVWGRNEEKNQRAVEELEAAGAVVMSVVVDVSDEDEVDAATGATLDRFERIDTLIANAGVSLPGPIHTLPLEQWRAVMSINLDGAFLCFRAAAAHMIERGGGGALVGVSSTSAIHGAAGNEAYSASKTALLGLVRGLAVELARHGIRANSLMPGWTETEMTAPLLGWEKFMQRTTDRTPARRWATPDDMGPAAVFLSDPTLAFHTGDCIVVDGGYTIF
jgi:NAD(P)-dependent dehydrogenase (short-subunit alcohol dehydrogenase family)